MGTNYISFTRFDSFISSFRKKKLMRPFQGLVQYCPNNASHYFIQLTICSNTAFVQTGFVSGQQKLEKLEKLFTLTLKASLTTTAVS